MFKVLVVDDDRNILKLLDFTLQDAGFSVMTARNGEEGLAAALDHPPDVAVLDVMMPGVHGYELCRRLRADSRTAEAKIIFLTARSQPIDEQEARKAGADMFLSKPVMPDELVLKIRSLLSGAEPRVPPPKEPEPPSRPRMRKAAPSTPKAAGHAVICYSPTPGVGVTSLVANLVLALSLARRAKTPVVELHAVPGNLVSALGLRSEPPIGNLAATGTSLSWDTLALHLVDHASGVQVLPAPPRGSEVLPSLTHEAFSILRAHYPLVLVDADKDLDRVQPVLGAGDLVLLVIAPEQPVMEAATQAIHQLRRQAFPERQILLIVNQVHSEAAVPVDQIRKEMGHPLFAVIPHEPDMEAALKSGRPILTTHPRSAATQAIGRMALQFARGFKLPLAAR